ncbi:unnamed protein product [Oikopleura dioica]|uniref:Uncharacterized protein n=1 Tax=Oikopleura dioica TaxID=34765 RepID=E4XBU0_OIKDI|nr:unnamed protein product [Oikopleura dioica]
MSIFSAVFVATHGLITFSAQNGEPLGSTEDMYGDTHSDPICYVKLSRNYNTHEYQPFIDNKDFQISWYRDCDNNEVLTFCNVVAINQLNSTKNVPFRVSFSILDSQHLTQNEEFTVDSGSCDGPETVKSILKWENMRTTFLHTKTSRASFGLSIFINTGKSHELISELYRILRNSTGDSSVQVTLLGNQTSQLESHSILGFEVEVHVCPVQIPLFDISFLSEDQCWRQRDINETILAAFDDDGKSSITIHGNYSSEVSSFVIITVAQGILLLATLIFSILIYKRRPYDHQFYPAEKTVYAFSIFIAFTRFLISTMICYQYPKNAFVNNEAIIIFFVFVLIDLLFYMMHFLNLLRRVWSNNIIGGHYYLPIALPTFFIGRNCPFSNVFCYFSRTLPVSGDIPIGIMLLIWTELLLIPIVLVIQSLDLRFHLPDLQKDNTQTFSTFVIINYLQIISQLFVNFSLFGATYLRQIIVFYYHDSEFSDLKALNRTTDSISRKSPLDLLALPGLQSFAPRLESCTSLNKFQFNGMGIENCFNNLETIILAIALGSG